MKNTGKILAGAAVAAAGGVLIYAAASHQNSSSAKTGSKEITVEVIHKDGSKKTFTYQTDEEYLGDLLQKEGLIEGEDGQYGIFVTEVDGEKSVFGQDGSWWQLSENGKPSESGADALPITDQAVYTWTYMGS